MIQSGSYLNIIDNSGAKRVFCIKIVNCGFKQRYAGIGAVILVSIKKIKFAKNNKVKKGEICKALVVKIKKQKYSSFRNYIKFSENAAILLNKKNKLLGSRILKKIPKYLKYTKFLKLASLAPGLIL